MIERSYFIGAKCTDGNGYCFQAKIMMYKSFLPNAGEVYTEMTNELKAELLAIRPNGQFEVVSFNRC